MATRQSNSNRDSYSPHVEPTLYVGAFQATIATATIGGLLICRAARVRALLIGVGVCGTAGSTVVQVHVNGASVGEVSVDNAAADGTMANIGLDAALAVGDRLEIVVSTAPTGGSDLAVTVLVVDNAL